MTLSNDRDYLSELARQVHRGVIVEIGSYTGRSARAMAEAASVPVYCIDLWDLSYPADRRRKIKAGKKHTAPGNFTAFLENTRGLNVISVKGISSEIAKVWDRPISLLFIDGDHSYSGCKMDYQGFAHHIIPGGYLVFHDYHEKRRGVVRAVNEIRKLPGWSEWTEQGHSTISAIKEGT